MSLNLTRKKADDNLKAAKRCEYNSDYAMFTLYFQDVAQRTDKRAQLYSKHALATSNAYHGSRKPEKIRQIQERKTTSSLKKQFYDHKC